MPSVTVRTATPADIETVRALAARAWCDAYADILEPETIDAAIDEWYDTDTLRDSLDEADATFYVAEGGSIVGFLRGGLGEEVAYLGAIYADPDRLGEGIGSQLLDRFEGFCADHGYDAIELAVLAGNDVGRSFYRARGYELVADREVDLFGETVADSVFRGSVRD